MNRLIKYIMSVMFIALLLEGLSLAPIKADASFNDREELIIINKQNNTLIYFNSQNEVYNFSVATGKTKNLTPAGEYRIVNKIIDRPYYKKKIPGGDPKNPLGRRWLGLDINGTPGTTYAIHGNNNESLIGQYVTAGCIRMKNKEIEWLFENVKTNTKVWIIDSPHTLKKIIASRY